MQQTIFAAEARSANERADRLQQELEDMKKEQAEMKAYMALGKKRAAEAQVCCLPNCPGSSPIYGRYQEWNPVCVSCANALCAMDY